MALTFLADALMVRVTAVFRPSRWEPPSDVRIPEGHHGEEMSARVIERERRARERQSERDGG